MYYLFMRKESDILKYKSDFYRVKQNISMGKTPVYSEMRSAKINLIESAPYNILMGTFMVLSTIIIDSVNINDTAKIAVVLVVNSMCGALSNYIFTVIKHMLRARLCKRIGIEFSEENIAVMESLEYQSV